MDEEGFKMVITEDDSMLKLKTWDFILWVYVCARAKIIILQIIIRKTLGGELSVWLGDKVIKYARRTRRPLE